MNKSKLFINIFKPDLELIVTFGHLLQSELLIFKVKSKIYFKLNYFYLPSLTKLTAASTALLPIPTINTLLPSILFTVALLNLTL